MNYNFTLCSTREDAMYFVTFLISGTEIGVSIRLVEQDEIMVESFGVPTVIFGAE